MTEQINHKPDRVERSNRVALATVGSKTCSGSDPRPALLPTNPRR